MSSKKKDTRKRILEATWRLMEQHKGQGVAMGDIAKRAGISRQALYLHFKTRTELMVATVQYVDGVKNLDERLNQLNASGSGVELLERYIETWGNYIPEVYSLAKALLNTRENDEAAAVAWSGCMTTLRDICRQVIESMDNEGTLDHEWNQDEAVEMLWTTVSIHSWEQLTIECGWSTMKYIDRMKVLLLNALVSKRVYPGTRNRHDENPAPTKKKSRSNHG
jgi:AcrR family transcriptional regulator